MKELLKKFSITILSILRHGSKQEQPCINLSEFIFLNDNLPYLSIDNLFVAFKKDTNNLSEDIIKSILDQDHFFDYLNDILLTSECKFIIKNINGVDYIAAKTRHSKDIINLNYQKRQTTEVERR
jgi:hypothetical protein